MEDEYKVVCALSNGAAFDDLEWPRKANISQTDETVHPIHSMFVPVRVFGVGGSNDTIRSSKKIQDGGWRPSWTYKNGHNYVTGLLIDVMFASWVRFSESADLMMPLSMTLSDPEPQFQGHSIV